MERGVLRSWFWVIVGCVGFGSLVVGCSFCGRVGVGGWGERSGGVLGGGEGGLSLICLHGIGFFVWGFGGV